MHSQFRLIGSTSDPVGALKCNFPPCRKLYRKTDQPTDQQTYMREQREVTLPISSIKWTIQSDTHTCIWTKSILNKRPADSEPCCWCDGLTVNMWECVSGGGSEWLRSQIIKNKPYPIFPSWALLLFINIIYNFLTDTLKHAHVCWWCCVILSLKIALYNNSFNVFVWRAWSVGAHWEQ